jgi:tetratricopeptide (TPR) repeat protein
MKPHASRPGGHPRIAEFTGPLSIPGGDVAGAEIVRELGAEVSLAVWQTLRGVLMWAAETPGARPALFDAEAMRAWECELLEASWEPELRYPLAVLVGELAGEPTPEPIARACLCVTDWALTREAWSTALAFAEAAALAWPEHPRYAWMVGRLLRKRGRLREAEQWIRRCIRVAVAAGDWEAQALGLNSLGNVNYEMGDYRQAQRSQNRALRITRKQGLREHEGEVLHDLFVATAHLGDLASAEEYARGALEIYIPSHHRLPALAYDVAFVWMKRGYYSRALGVLLELATFFEAPQERALLLASAARSAAACGRNELFTALMAESSALADESRDKTGIAHALLQLGVGAAATGLWSVSEELLDRANELARTRGESDVISEAEEALAAVRDRRTLGTSKAEPHNRTGETLARSFVHSLRSAPIPSELAAS